MGNSIEAAMFLSRPAFAAARRAAVSPMIKRSFTSSIVRREAAPTPASGSNEGKIKKFQDIKSEADLIPWCRARNHSHRSRAGYWFGPIGNLGKGAGHRYLRHEAIGCFPPRHA